MQLHFTRKSLFASAAVSALLGAAAPAMAQTVQHAPPPAADAATNIDDVVVTAQRREQSLQDVPVTLTVLSGELIEKARIQSIQDIVNHTPGLQFDAYPSSEPRLAIRGVGSSSRGAAGDPSAAVFVDEIYYGRPAAIAFETFDLARIEVLKGPQGTLFGRNVTGGAISVITHPADPDGFAAGIEAAIGNFNRSDLASYVNVPFADGKAAARLSGALHQHDGYTDRLDPTTNAKVGELDDQDTTSGRVQLHVEPTTAFRVDLGADTTTDRAAGPGNRVLVDTGTGSLTNRYVLNTAREYTYASIDGNQDRDTWGVRGKLAWDLPFGTLSLLSSYRELGYYSTYDFDGSATPAGRSARNIGGLVTEDTSFSSNELKLNSRSDSKTTWVVGLYNYHADTDRLQRSTMNITAAEDIFQSTGTDSWAAYGDVTVPVTDRLNVFGGLRYTRDEKDNHIVGSGTPGVFNLTSTYDVTGSDSWDATTWRIGADYHFTPRLMLYGTISRGYKSGGFQETPGTATEAATPFDSEYVTNYEIGQRGAFFNNSLIWNNSIFVMKYSNFQVRRASGTGFLTANAGESTIQGLESELVWRPGNGWRFSGVYAYTDGKFDDYPSVESGVLVNYAGNSPTRLPANKLTLSPSYTYDFGSGASVEFALDYAFESEIYDAASNKGPEVREPTNFVDTRIVFTNPDGHWNLSVWGKNITNEETKTFEALFGGVLFAAYNPPTTYGATLRWKY